MFIRSEGRVINHGHRPWLWLAPQSGASTSKKPRWATPLRILAGECQVLLELEFVLFSGGNQVGFASGGFVFVEGAIASVLGAFAARVTAAEELEQERARLELQWRQCVERAVYQADRAARQYQAVEPKNRLVARTLEQNWEAALREQQQLTREYEDFRRTQPLTLTEAQREWIRHLAQDIPALWAAPTTTPQDRQQIVRMLIERIELNIEGDSERTEVTITWAGGFTSQDRLRRVVCSYSQRYDLEPLITRVVQLRQSGLSLKQVAAQFNEQGIVSLRGSPFTTTILSRLLVRRGLYLPYGRKRPDSVALAEHEWWLPDMADELHMPRTSLTHWYNRGWVRGRKLPGLRGRLIIWANEAEVNRLKQLRDTRRRWSDSPYPQDLTTPQSPSDRCSENCKGADYE